MTATLDTTGLTIQSFDDVFAEFVASLQSGLALTNAQTDRVRTAVTSTLGNWSRISAENEARIQEMLLAVYNTLAIESQGVQLDRVVRLLGVSRRAAENSRVLGLATGTAATAIPDGTRIRYNPTGAVFLVDGAQVLNGSGELDDMPVVAETDAAIEVALDPAVGFDDWTVLDTIVGFSDVGGFEATEQPIVGHPIEVDAALRVRANTEAYRRAQGPLVAIDAAVADVSGVTYVRTYDNRDTQPTDADGIPWKAINVVVEGGSDLDVANAIWRSRSAGAGLFGAVQQAIIDRYGRTQIVGFDRVDELRIYIRVTVTTSTSEETAPADLRDQVIARLTERAPLLFGIGADVLPLRLAAQLADISGIDAALIELSLDGVSYSSAKRAVTIRQRATFDGDDITYVEN